MNKSRRESFLKVFRSSSAKVALQVTSHSEIFRDGSLRQIHGKIITLHAARGTQGRRRGLSKVWLSHNGSYLDRALRAFCGFTANVRVCNSRKLSPKLMVHSLVAGAGKTILW